MSSRWCCDYVTGESLSLLTLFPHFSGEQSRIDHLVFIVHGIGAHHDLSFRSLVDCGESSALKTQLLD